MTPTVDRTGGTEKCMSWLVEELSRRCDLTLVAGRVTDTDLSGVELRILPTIRRPRLLRYLTFLVACNLAFGMRALLRRPRFDAVIATSADCVAADIVYAHFCCAAWLDAIDGDAAGLLSRTFGQRLRNAHYRLFLHVASWVEHAIYKLGPAVVAVSAGTKRELERYYGVAPERVTVIPNAVDERVRLTPHEHARLRQMVRARYAIDADETVAVFVGAGDWKRKNLRVVIGAIALLRDARVRLLVVGDEDIPHYAAETVALGIADRVTFVGFVPDVEAYYAAADVFVYPSRYEAFALVTLEAAGAGLPLIVTHVSGTDELVRDGENGWFVEPTAEDVAAKLGPLVLDPELRQRMSRAAERRSREFTRERVAERILAQVRPRTSPSRAQLEENAP